VFTESLPSNGHTLQNIKKFLILISILQCTEIRRLPLRQPCSLLLLKTFLKTNTRERVWKALDFFGIFEHSVIVSVLCWVNLKIRVGIF
jgi:hypothetical protein